MDNFVSAFLRIEAAQAVTSSWFKEYKGLQEDDIKWNFNAN